MTRFFRKPLDDVMGSLRHLMTTAHPARVMIPSMIAMIVTWFIYVPIHELLHVYGCIWTGGSVSELHLQAHYGGAILAKWFPFIVAGGDYAGQVTGFDTKENDLIYLATDFLPFMLSVLFGVLLLRLCTKKRRPLLFGPAIVVGLAPFYNLPGDYYEMASTMITRLLTWVSGETWPPRFEGLRSDDIFTLVPEMISKPAELGLDTSAPSMIFAFLVVLTSILLSILLAFVTYNLGDLIARPIAGPAPAPIRRKRPSRRAPAT